MRKASVRPRRRPGKPRSDVMSELPMVTAMLIAAVAVAAFAAGGPVLDMLAGLSDLWES